jgi:phosphoribosyl 1,2-cyclic phosphodiesterase
LYEWTHGNSVTILSFPALTKVKEFNYGNTPTFALRMSLWIASLNSGSNGNCYYIGNQEEAVLVDAGLSCRETERRMKRLGLSLRKVKGIFISHEHSDHVGGVASLSKKYQLPVYITAATLQHGNLHIKEEFINAFRAYEPVGIGNLSVTAFPKFHDAVDPHSFIVSSKEVNVGVFTDVGSSCQHVIKHFEQCHAAFLESNYDEDLLARGNYPISLQNRIRGGKGHLSNSEALQLFLLHRPAFMSHLLLSHLSANNNSQRIVKELFDRIAGGTKIIIASRYKETQLYQIVNGSGGRCRGSVGQQLQLSFQ